MNRNLSTTINGQLEDMKENASDATLLKTLDSPVLRPVHGKSPILHARQKMSLEKTTGYDYWILRRERGKTRGRMVRRTCYRLVHPNQGWLENLATSEILLEETPYLKLTTRGRKTGLERNVQLWFVYENGRLLFLAHEDSHWWRNIAQHSRVQVEAGEILFEGTGKLVPDKLAHAFELFRRKYGDSQIERWYSGKRSQRRAVEVELGRVLGKRPSRTSSEQQIAI